MKKRKNISFDIRDLSTDQQTACKMAVAGAIAVAKNTLAQLGLSSRLIKEKGLYNLIWTNSKICKISVEATTGFLINQLESQVKDRKLFYTLTDCIFSETSEGANAPVKVLEAA